jgi:hypothetical protein
LPDNSNLLIIRPFLIVLSIAISSQSSSAPAYTELGQTFASSSDATIWATDVLGEFEINNKEPITKIGSGLHPKVKQEKRLATDQLNKREFNKLGFGPKVLAKIKNLSIRDQSSVYSNLIDDIAVVTSDYCIFYDLHGRLPYATYFPSKFSHAIVSSIFFYLFFRFCK